MRSLIAFIITTCGLVLSFLPSDGAEWKIIPQKEDSVYYYDEESITYPTNDTVRIWYKHTNTKMYIGGPAKNNGTVREAEKVLSLYEVNCSLRMYRLLLSEIYYKDGEVSQTDNRDAE